MESHKPVPAITAELAPFFKAAREGHLMVQRCEGCGKLRFPPRRVCPACLASQSTWTKVSGRGEVYSFNVMHQVYHPAFAAEVPYAVVVVRLEEGPKIVSNLVGVGAQQVRCGMPVEAVFEQLSDEVTVPKFRPRVS